MFLTDKQYGEEMQKAFCKLLVKEGYAIQHIAVDEFPDWDIQITTGKTFEVKTDRKAKETGNIFIETGYRGMPSGLSRTNADYFVIIVANFAHVSSVEDTMRFVLHYPRKTFIQRAGDDGLSQGYLIKENEYKPKNMRLYEIDI